MQDSLRELHIQTPSNTPGVLCSHSRLTDLLFISTCLCSFVFLCVVMKTSAECVQRHSWSRNIRAHRRGHSTQQSVEAYWTESGGPLGETLQKQRGQRAEEGKRGHHTTPAPSSRPATALRNSPASNTNPKFLTFAP